MKREFEKYLEKWRVSKDRKPLLVRGARQVGKTYTITKFAKEHFEHVVYISFDIDRYLDVILKETLNPQEILDAISQKLQIPIIEGKTIIIFDEVQEQPRALTSLKYFNENMPRIHVIASGSALGVLLHKGFSFPVGKVDTQYMRALSFSEFVAAVENEEMAKILNDTDKMRFFASTFEKRLKQYFYIGGMPEIVASFVKNNDYAEVRALHEKIISDYKADFSKYNDYDTALKINAIFDSIPSQVSRENKKFKYSEIKKGSRADDYLVSLGWLENSDLIRKVLAIYEPKIPLKFYEQQPIFKLFINDVGLLGAIIGIHSETILQGNALFTEFKGALAEQFICSHLYSNFHRMNYWTTEQSKNEIDFLLQAWDSCVPVEVKSGFNTQAKSLKVFREKYQPKLSFRLSLNDYNKTDDLIDLPLYAVHLIPKIIEEYNKK
ncbi:ATPase [Bacteroidia bacterium]|nr:ATPase [Bacteroidia bacterium]